VDTPAADHPVSTRVLTLPNGLSTLRLLGVPLFLYLVLVPHADLAAFGVLAVGSFTDWLDGRLARAWNQVTRIGQLLDPVADRLYIVATVAALAIRGILPWWLAVALLARDVVLAVTLPVLRHHGHGPLPVHFLGKAATFNLLYAFPLLLLGAVDGVVGTVAAPVGWAFTGWGAALYWWAALLYLAQCAVLVRAARADRSARVGGDGAGAGP
jgi:cardiolipin synthase